MNIQTSNPYEMDDPNIDSDDYFCTNRQPCGKCDVCVDEAADSRRRVIMYIVTGVIACWLILSVAGLQISMNQFLMKKASAVKRR